METILNNFKVRTTLSDVYYTLVLFMDYIGTDGYENAEEVCGEYNFKTKDDIEEYIQKAADYVATKYKIDLEYNIYDEEEQFEIVFSDSDKILIKGYWEYLC